MIVERRMNRADKFVSCWSVTRIFSSLVWPIFISLPLDYSPQACMNDALVLKFDLFSWQMAGCVYRIILESCIGLTVTRILRKWQHSEDSWNIDTRPLMIN